MWTSKVEEGGGVEPHWHCSAPVSSRAPPHGGITLRRWRKVEESNPHAEARAGFQDRLLTTEPYLPKWRECEDSNPSGTGLESVRHNLRSLPNGDPGRSRTDNLRFLRPAPLPSWATGPWSSCPESNRDDRVCNPARLPGAGTSGRRGARIPISSFSDWRYSVSAIRPRWWSTQGSNLTGFRTGVTARQGLRCPPRTPWCPRRDSNPH